MPFSNKGKVRRIPAPVTSLQARTRQLISWRSPVKIARTRVIADCPGPNSLKPLAAYRKRKKDGVRRRRRVLAHYEEQTENEALAEDAGIESCETVMNVPHDLVPKVREPIAKHQR